MKYIRTKDNVWQYDRNKNIVRPSEDGKSIAYWLNFDEKEIIQQADTIEELCDELVIKYKNEEKPRYIDMSKLLEACKNVGLTFREHVKWLFAYYKDRLEICKLAIRTDKGLIYVAKMNEKGELELL